MTADMAMLSRKAIMKTKRTVEYFLSNFNVFPLIKRHKVHLVKGILIEGEFVNVKTHPADERELGQYVKYVRLRFGSYYGP